MTKKPKTPLQQVKRTAHEPQKTNRQGARLPRQLAGIEEHLERHPKDGMSRARVSRIKDIMAGRG